jgi:hypothetical protein
LVSATNQSVPFLRDRLKPVARADPKKIEQWIADLDSDKFADRQAAARALEKVGQQARPFLQKALKADVSLEARRRLEQILGVVSDVPAETVRTIRAITVLERIGSREAQSVLATLAEGRISYSGRQLDFSKSRLQRSLQGGGAHPRANSPTTRPTDGVQMEQTSIPKWQIVTGWVLSGILSVLFLPSAFFKIAQPTGFLDEWTKTYPAEKTLLTS